MAELKNIIIRKDVPKNETSDRIISIVEKILNFNRKKKGKRLKILTPKQMLQRLPIALAQLKGGNSSENLLYEIC